MGRRFPHDNLSLIHPILYLSFLVVGLAASIAMVTGICGLRFRRKSSPSPSNPLEIAKDLDASTYTPQENPQTKIDNSENSIETENNDNMQTKELPLPPAMQQPKDLLSTSKTMMNRATSERRSSFSLSLKMPRSFSVARNRDHNKSFSVAKNIEENIKAKLKAEDSVWMKTIILGEKCVPGEEDPVIYEGKGKKISAYHPKTNSMCFSRQVSFNDPDAFSVPQSQIQEERLIQNHQ